MMRKREQGGEKREEEKEDYAILCFYIADFG